MTFSFNKYGRDLGTRLLGIRVRNDLMKAINDNADDKVVLDFSDIDIVTNAFADECLVKLSEYMTLRSFIDKTTFSNINDTARLNIALSFKRRYPYINHL